MNLVRQVKIKFNKSYQFIFFFLASLAVILFIYVLPALTKPVEISVLIQALESAQLQPLVTEFNQKHPDIKLEIIEAPNASNQVEDLYTSSFLLGESPYDLVYMDIVWTPKFAAADWLLPLEDRVSDSELENFLDGDVAGGSYNNSLYRMPFRSDAGMLYYRSDLLAKAGKNPPETFSELIATAREIQTETDVNWGFLWQGKQYEGLAAFFVEILEGYGGFWVDPESLEVGLDRQNAIEAIEFLRSTIAENVSPRGVTTYIEPDTHRLFISGESVFMRNWPYVYSLASAPDSPIRGKFEIKPMVRAPGYNSGACLGGWGFGISKTTKHPDAAWEVIEFFTSKASQKKYVLSTGYVPSRKSLFNDPEIVAKYAHYPELLNIVEQSALRPPIAQYSQASDILQRYLSAALTDTMTSEAAMQAAAAETRRLLAR
ncbi:MAG: ABC transporter substrate-binding protein [Prochloraceae cyanobacterium]